MNTQPEADHGGLQFLDGIQGLAAFYVMVGHARWFLWEGYSAGYTLYVIHFPVLVLPSGWLMAQNLKGSLPAHFGWALAGIFASLGIAYALHFLVEKPFLGRAKARSPAAAHAG